MTQTKSAMPVPYQRGSTLNSTTLYKGGLFSFLVKGGGFGGSRRNLRTLINHKVSM